MPAAFRLQWLLLVKEVCDEQDTAYLYASVLVKPPTIYAAVYELF
jgi:hypothetical protein